MFTDFGQSQLTHELLGERKAYLRPIKELVLLLTDTADPDQQ